MTTDTVESLLSRLRKLTTIGASLSAERDTTQLLESILVAAQEVTFADAGTLYLVDKNLLRFEILHNNSLNIAMGGKSGKPATLGPVALYREDGSLNDTLVVTSAVLHNHTINIPDVYAEERYDFTGTRAFDEKTGYRSQSFLTIPLKNHQNEVIGALQLINSIHPSSGETIPFSPDAQELAESLASQAAIALTNRNLLDQMRELFEALIQGISVAIDEKSPYTGSHGQRVPELALMLAQAAHATREGPYAEFQMSEAEFYELKIAGLLHDCGKLATPVHVVDKATKLETIFDRIQLIEARFVILKREAEIAMLKERIELLSQGADEAQFDAQQARLREKWAALDEEFEFLNHCNFGREFMSPAHQERVNRIGERCYANRRDETAKLLSAEENLCLNIPRGTLTDDEREIINRHVLTSMIMLEQLPWPRELRNVPLIAGAHHERIDGKGYPMGLTGDQMSVQMKVLAIADVFEALTAKDRPYRPGMSLMQALTILGRMAMDNHIDRDLFRLFIRDKVYLQYAQRFLSESQFDAVDESRIPGLAD
ncbi:MAG: GAF domain-containing protein [Sulfuricella sp.]|nr:GAF domain-containing protein [Sulfuricella sp.]